MGLLNRLVFLSGYTDDQLRYEYYSNGQQLELLQQQLEKRQELEANITPQDLIAAGMPNMAIALQSTDGFVAQEIARYSGYQRDIEIKAAKQGLDLDDFDADAYLREGGYVAVRDENGYLVGSRDASPADIERPSLPPLDQAAPTPASAESESLELDR